MSVEKTLKIFKVDRPFSQISLIYVRVPNIRLMDVTFFYTAIKYDNIDVFGYTAWSLLDGFEWQHAYTIRRGLFYVDFESEKKERIPKSSALYYKQIIQENGFFPREITPSLQAQFSCDFSWGVTESVLKVSANYWEGCWRQSNQQLRFANK